jgi:hypothetical protein
MVLGELELGQVFTPPDVADFMVKLFVDELEDGAKILDPCIGCNVFFNTLNSRTSNFDFHGVEIDSKLLIESIRNIYKDPRNDLFEGDFFDFPYDNQFDYAILNPPYIRQEKIINKKQIFETLSPSQLEVSKKSNMFVYFILKTINHLKQNGKFVAIIYDSWLYSDFGISFRKVLVSEGCVEEIYHFREEVFPNALVGATVLVFSKKKQTKQTKYFKYPRFRDINSDIQPEKIDLLTFNFSKQTTHPNEHIFVRIKDLCSLNITRGIGTPHNPTFYQLPSQEIEHIDLMKSTKMITGMKVELEFLEKVLHVSDIVNVDDVTADYLKEVELGLSEQSNVKTLKYLIEEEKDWYKLNLRQPGNIIFNYYLRNNIKFVSNEMKHYAANNFYQMKIDYHFKAQFAILNSTFTIRTVENSAKPQGNGLKKIQLNQFREIRVIDASSISETSRESLSALGGKLIDADEKSIPRIRKEIDEIMDLVLE